jgi:serine/threonine protein kinase
LKILTVCSSTDFPGDDFKALIYEFLPNGNLHEWLHLHPERKGERKVLDLVQRISIAIVVASAIVYLHHHNPFPIIHCDLKPTNVLIDNNMVAQVGDFGLARFLHEDSSDILEQSTSWAAMRGTIGYAAPGLLLIFILWLLPSRIFFHTCL